MHFPYAGLCSLNRCSISKPQFSKEWRHRRDRTGKPWPRGKSRVRITLPSCIGEAYGAAGQKLRHCNKTQVTVECQKGLKVLVDERTVFTFIVCGFRLISACLLSSLIPKSGWDWPSQNFWVRSRYYLQLFLCLSNDSVL